MAKKSRQRAPRQKRDHPGCMWGLMSMFDFRHGRTTRRMLSDRRRHMADNTHGSSYPTSEANLPTNSDEMHLSIEDREKIKKPAFDLVRTRVKELIEDEMFVDRDLKKQNDTKKVESFDLECSSRVSNRKHPEKTSKKSVDHEISISRQVSAPKASQYHDLEELVKEILVIHQKKNNEQQGDLNPGAKRSFPIVEEKLIAAVEVLLNEKSSNGDLKQIRHSKEMFQMLSSNKEMFLKLLQDQNSILLNEDQKSKSKSMAGSNLLEPEEPVRKNRKFFRRRSKSQECISLNGKDKIVLLKPGSPENRVPIGNDIHTDGNGSQFSFMEIKRRLKQAMGKPGPGERSGKTVADGGWSSPNRDHFYTERFARVANGLKTGDRVSKLRDSETINGDANHRISNIYVEAKKHLSEMLTSGDEDAETMMRSLPKSLGRILSLRDYSSVSPGTSPREDLRTVNKSQPLTTNDISKEKVVVSDDMASEGILEIISLPSCDQEQPEQMEDFDVSREPCGSSINDDHEAVIFDGSNEERSSESLKTDLPDENESSTSRTRIEPSLAGKNEELEITPGDRAGKPSPISVLEPLFSDDDVSPARTVSRPEAAIQPLCIQFEEPVCVSKDQQIRITDSADTEESAFEYVEAVLLSSDLNWLEFEKRWLSAVQILDPSLFEEVETFSSRARYDQRLLFDSTNEALEEVCDRFIPESSFIKPKVWPVPKGMDLINEVWSRLESRLGKVYPRDLNKLVRNDLETSRTWLDLRSESRQIVIEIEESIFEETMDDTLFEFIQDIRD
ncbi:uncharacterized protein LOC112526684 isoform X2 [Cynara cardunculus var. scolymus]|uniref:uncharacterized protein LOC112526684 isoform X2 n=1 Tax=Cynara cardunculus var. scolymus TaxID=59895 RepID=UPI000D62DD69|nr:uncharacterized protein LOC112526684 isoform X2 [Cynara cardunculus var. scolymus]